MDVLSDPLFVLLARLLAHPDDDVRHAPLIAVGASHGGGPDALHARTLVHVSFGDNQLVDVDVIRPVFGVGDGGPQHLFDHRRDALVGGAQDIDGRAGPLAADEVHHQPRFLRRYSNVSRFSLIHSSSSLRSVDDSFVLSFLRSHSARGWRCNRHDGFAVFSVEAAAGAAPGAPPVVGAAAAFTEWPRNWRVGENSPSLRPTMFSVMYTGMNFLPLCTASVWPMNSGKMVDRRDQVRTTFFSFFVFISSTLFIRWSSTNGPLCSERPITVS